VACPALGTTLASGRLDRWLSVLSFLTGDNDAIDFLLGIVKKRTDPRALPGLEAMMPGSAVVSLLNQPGLQTSADLSVIAGDIKGDSIWSTLKWQIADWFYAGEHDLVVNTGSMYGGIKRLPDNASFVFDQGAAVNHFNYFTNKSTVSALVSGLTRAEGVQAGFKPITSDKIVKPARSLTQRDQNKPAPVVFVLPGTMGSHLQVAGDRIWLEYDELVLGRLAGLGITMKNVTSTDVIDDYYGDFIAYLSRQHNVVTFHYDWRLSIQKAAQQLADSVSEKLKYCEASAQPLHFTAHSMGGLVVRTMIALKPDLWARIKALPNSRLIMFGTPNAGSYEAVRWLTGWNPTQTKLTLLDFAHDAVGVVNIVNRYPGLLELLPSADKNRDFSKPQVWDAIMEGASSRWPKPLLENLQNLPETWKLIKNSPIDSERMIYVAGCAEHTVSDFVQQLQKTDRGFLSEDRPPIRFMSTREGDGTVSWAFGLLPGVKTWYLPDTAHDQLLNVSAAFPAIVDLLQTGITKRAELLTAPPASNQSRGIMTEWMPIERIDSLPDRRDVQGFVFGSPRPVKIQQETKLPLVNITLLQGSLAYARHPIVVGHYWGDTIVSAEAELDKRLDYALSKRVRLGLYPGLLGSHHVFIRSDENVKPEGAIVIGLGMVGELSPGRLKTGMASALLDYALKVIEWPDDRFGEKQTTRSAKISCLLIGTGFGGMAIRDSLKALLEGILAANQRLAVTKFDSQVLIDEVEFIEIYQDIAISAARELSIVLQEADLAEQFFWPEQCIQEGPGSLRRVVFDEAPNWWQRMEITFDKKRDEMRFIALTDRARAEESLVAGQLCKADQFIEGAIANTANSKLMSQTLFEMLLPNRIKELAPNQYDVVLIVDEISARYPWELLQDRWGSARQPPSVTAGLVRQLKTTRYREHPAHTAKANAFVVGNPKLASLNFADLPGAAQEAEVVSKMLVEYGYQVNSPVINLTANDIVSGLLAADEYRILHLAGHGVHEYPVAQKSNLLTDEPAAIRYVSGMVIGDEVFLEPSFISKMRWVPELVFINCCYLGSMTNTLPQSQRYNELAANLAAEFIAMGVKAVVAAGWAVDDDAAAAFAKTFYGAMLRGDSFGRAVTVARKTSYEHFPQTNTWGAYQCYGDPDFRLKDQIKTDWKNKPPYHAPVELVSDLQNLLSKLQFSELGQADPIWLEQWQGRIDNCLKLIPARFNENWLNRADVTAALGNVYGKLGQLQLAINYLERAVKGNDSDLSVDALQQLAKLKIQLSLQRAFSGELALKMAIADIQKQRDSLLVFCDLAPTAQRFGLLGEANKAQAWLEKTKSASLAAIKLAAANFKHAFDQSKALTGQIDANWLINWVLADLVQSWLDSKYKLIWLADWPKLCEQVVLEAKQSKVFDAEIKCKAVQSTCLLVSALVNEQISDEQQLLITENFRVIGLRYRTLEQLEFLCAMAEKLDKTELATALKQIREGIS